MINLNNIWSKQNASNTRWRTDGKDAFKAAEASPTVSSWIVGQAWGFDLCLTNSSGIT
jgi:hypothetical protein